MVQGGETGGRSAPNRGVGGMSARLAESPQQAGLQDTHMIFIARTSHSVHEERCHRRLGRLPLQISCCSVEAGCMPAGSEVGSSTGMSMYLGRGGLWEQGSSYRAGFCSRSVSSCYR